MAICVMCVNVNDTTINFYKTIKTHDIYVLIDNNKVKTALFQRKKRWLVHPTKKGNKSNYDFCYSASRR